jgi:hypothetical protein
MGYVVEITVFAMWHWPLEGKLSREMFQPAFLHLWRCITDTNSVAPEPEGSSPHSPDPANGPYPEPAESIPHSPHACHMPHPPHPSWFYLPNNIWWWVQIMKLPTVQLSPITSSLLGPNILLYIDTDKGIIFAAIQQQFLPTSLPGCARNGPQRSSGKFSVTWSSYVLNTKLTAVCPKLFSLRHVVLVPFLISIPAIWIPLKERRQHKKTSTVVTGSGRLRWIGAFFRSHWYRELFWGTAACTGTAVATDCDFWNVGSPFPASRQLRILFNLIVTGIIHGRVYCPVQNLSFQWKTARSVLRELQL